MNKKEKRFRLFERQNLESTTLRGNSNFMAELLDLQWWEWGMLLLATVFIGFSKAGLKGISPIWVMMVVLIYGAKASTGIIVPMLIAGDILAVRYYRRSADWRLLWRFFPFMFVGVLLGVWVGKDLDEQTFRYSMAAIILFSVAFMTWNDLRKSDYVPDNLWFCLLYTSPSPRDATLSRMPSSA